MRQNVVNDWNNPCTLNHARMSIQGVGVWFLWKRSLSTEKLRLLSKRNSLFIQTQDRFQRALESLQVAEHNACKGCGKSAVAHARLSVTQRDCSLDCLTRDKRSANRRKCSRCVTVYFFHAYTTTDKREQIKYWHFPVKFREKETSKKKKKLPLFFTNFVLITYESVCNFSLHFTSIRFLLSLILLVIYLFIFAYFFPSVYLCIWLLLLDCFRFYTPNSNFHLLSSFHSSYSYLSSLFLHASLIFYSSPIYLQSTPVIATSVYAISFL